MARAVVRGLRRLPAVADDEAAEPGFPGQREDDVDLKMMILDVARKIKQLVEGSS
ncbi:MAG: hypothetical protein JXB32_25980 [Deltaproteobacteria bacterium]|nr:hypothetical protein [Deltaproteobacteria bacterium]